MLGRNVFERHVNFLFIFCILKVYLKKTIDNFLCVSEWALKVSVICLIHDKKCFKSDSYGWTQNISRNWISFHLDISILPGNMITSFYHELICRKHHIISYHVNIKCDFIDYLYLCIKIMLFSSVPIIKAATSKLQTNSALLQMRHWPLMCFLSSVR